MPLCRRFLGSGLLRSTLPCHDWRPRFLRGMESRPALLGGFRDGLFASGAELSLRFGSLRHDRRRRHRLLLGFSPPFPLGVTDALPGGGTHAPLAFWTFWRGGGRRGRAGQHGAEFGYLGVDTKLLLFKTFDGGVDDLGCEFVGGHIWSGASLTFHANSTLLTAVTCCSSKRFDGDTLPFLGRTLHILCRKRRRVGMEGWAKYRGENRRGSRQLRSCLLYTSPS